MYLFYVDESGTPDPISINKKGGCSNNFIIGGILIKTDFSQKLEEEFYEIKEKYLKNPLLELKYNSPPSNIKKGYNKEIVREKVYDFINNSSQNFKIITAVIDKTNLGEKNYFSKNKESIYYYALQFLLERINYELSALKDSCLVILDSRNKKDNKTLYSSYMYLLKHGTNQQNADKFNHFLPSIAFSDSEFCMNLCVADFCCASVFQLEEFSRPRYYKTIKNKFRNINGVIEGYGIVHFP